VTFTITDTCIDTMDQSCVEVCPVDCIHFEEGVDRMLYIEPAECIDCGACQPACPVTAIFPEVDVPADQTRFNEINELWFTDAAAARALVDGGAAAPASSQPAAVNTPTSEEATADVAAGAADSSEAAPAAAAPSAPEPGAAPAVAASVAEVMAAAAGGPKFGESGIEGKCSLCGTYVIKGGIPFRERSVLCPDCAPKADTIGNPYHASTGQR
jgi:NAD-dependent dihydropyrimidine dehydrogenase PreA subunit